MGTMTTRRRKPRITPVGGVKRGPDRNALALLLEKGLTQQQIADEWYAKSGERVTREAIAMTIKKYGLKSAHKRERYPDLLPWRVRVEHTRAYDARMLRNEGRRLAGDELPEGEAKRLASWVRELRAAGAVVHYNGDTPQGFWWVVREDTDGDSLIRKPQ